jgi:hypothetical protein
MRFGRLFALAILLLLCAVAGAESSFAASSIPSSPSTNEVTVDGKWTTVGEWANATELRLRGRAGYICIKDDPGFLYILIDFTSDRTLDNRDMARVRFDIQNDKTEAPQTDDYMILVNWWEEALMTRTVQGNGTSWVPTDVDLKAEVASTNDSSNDPILARSHMIYEFAVPRDAFGDRSEIGFSATAGHKMRTSEANFVNLPIIQNHLNPSTWATLVFANPPKAQPVTTTASTTITATTIVETSTQTSTTPVQAGTQPAVFILVAIAVLAVASVYYLMRKRGGGAN